MTKDGAVFAKGKIKGDVNFPPYERLGPNAEHEVARFQVYPFKRILEYPRHIPYNSEKKSFLDKTGRESFEGECVSCPRLLQYIADIDRTSVPVHFQGSWG